MLKSPHREEASMDEVSIVGVDLAKQVFPLHGAGPDGQCSVCYFPAMSEQQEPLMVRGWADAKPQSGLI